MRRAFAVVCAAFAGACWSWDGLLSSDTAPFCTTVVDANACVDFDEAQFTSAWDIGKYEFTPTYAEVDDAAARSAPSSLLVHIDGGSTGISTYAQLAMGSSNAYAFDFWMRNESLTGATEARFFGIVISITGIDGGPSEYQLSIGAGTTPDVTRVVEQSVTYVSHPLADAGIAFPIGEWRHVHVVFAPSQSMLTLQVASEDGGTQSSSSVVLTPSNLGTATKWSARFGGFIVNPNVAWTARYDSITASW